MHRILEALTELKPHKESKEIMHSNYEHAGRMPDHRDQEREFYPSVENPQSSPGTKKKRRFSLWEPINEWIEQGKTLQCRRCGNIRTRMEFVQVSSMSSHKGNGLGGNANNAARAGAGMMTLGMSNAVWKKSHGSSSTTHRNQRMVLCENCGKTWAFHG